MRKQGILRNGFSLYFASFNRNKQSLTLDLRSAEGKAVLRKLIATADVVLDNFRPGVMEKIGLSRAELVRIKPDIVSCHITGFGLDGPYRDRPSFDFIAQAMSGFMSVNGAEGEAPARAAPPLSDLIAGAYAAMGICAALVRRERTGLGEEVATSAHRQHGRQPRVSRDALFRDRRAAAAHGQRPRAGRAVRPVRGGRRPGRDRAVQRPVLLQAHRRARASAFARASRVPDQSRPLRAPRRDQRHHQRGDRQAADRPLARRAERGRRARADA